MKKIALATMLIVSVNANAQFGDVALLAELVAQTEQLIEQVQAAKDMLDISAQLEQLETVKTIRSLHEDGRALVDLADETKKLAREIEGFTDDPLSLNQIETDIEWLRNALERADGDPNAAAAYGSILMQLKNIEFLAAAQSASKERLAEGANEEDKTQITATNAMIMSELLIANEQRTLQKEAVDTSVIESVLKGATYAPLGTQ